MAAPNIVRPSTITGKSNNVALTTGGVDILENPVGSGKVFKVNALYVANIDGTNSADATVSVVNASPSLTTKLAHAIPVGAKSTLAVIDKTTAIYLEEGDKITGSASANGDLDSTVSWEEIS